MTRIALLSLAAGLMAVTGSLITKTPAQAYCHHWRRCAEYRPVYNPYFYQPVAPVVNPYFAPSLRTRMVWNRGW